MLQYRNLYVAESNVYNGGDQVEASEQVVYTRNEICFY